MGAFDYLTSFVRSSPEDASGSVFFFPVTETEMREAERQIGLRLPRELATFYREIGSGFLKASRHSKDAPPHAYVNRVLDPIEAADLFLGLHEHTPVGEFAEGDLPVFEVGDQSFLVMRPGSNTPNAVYWDAGDPVCSSFARFIHRLYFDDALFYLRR
ncbi:MAG: hypothetical protein GY842_20095 [bacterium]|nr:hypothetical protein [bacterium]